MQRRAAVVVAIAALAAGSAALARVAAAKTEKRLRSSIINGITTPVGLQGAAGTGCNVLFVFSAAEAHARPVDVEVQFATDENQDGLIEEDEFHPATEDRLDARNTRDDKSPKLYPTERSGAVNVFVWKSCVDLPHARLDSSDYVLTPGGHLIADPKRPGRFLGIQLWGGVMVRMRTVQRRKHQWAKFGRWSTPGSFALSNASVPSMTIDSVASGDAVLVGWTAFDADSEDKNGNGQLDLALGEDLDADGKLGCEPMGAEFEFHRLRSAEDPASMTDEELGAEIWHPCTRLAGAGDTNTLEARPGDPVPTTGELAGVCSAPPGVGRRWTFAWDAVRDDAGANDRFILRATPFCWRHVVGATVYSRVVVQPGH